MFAGTTTFTLTETMQSLVEAGHGTGRWLFILPLTGYNHANNIINQRTPGWMSRPYEYVGDFHGHSGNRVRVSLAFDEVAELVDALDGDTSAAAKRFRQAVEAWRP